MASQSTKVALYILMFNMFITMSGIGLIIPVMPTYLALFGAAGQILGLLIATFSLAQFLFSPLAGELSDRFGRKNLIIVGLIIYGSAQFAFGISTDIWMLFVARFFGGLGSAFIIPPTMAFVADITSYEERGRGMGLIGAAMSLGFMIGPGIGGFLSKVNVHFPFYMAAAVAVIAAILSYMVLPTIKPLTNVQKKKENIFVQLKRSFHTPYFVMLTVVFVFSFGIANFQATMALFVDHKFSYSPSDIAILLTVSSFVGVIAQTFFVEKLFKWFGEMRVILLNLLVAAIATYLFIFVSGFWLILLITTIFSTATALIRPAVNTLVSKLAGDEQGFAAGMNNAYMSLGNMVGPALAGLLFDWKIQSPYYVGAVILLISLSVASIWSYRKAPHLLKAETHLK